MNEKYNKIFCRLSIKVFAKLGKNYYCKASLDVRKVAGFRKCFIKSIVLANKEQGKVAFCDSVTV